MTDKSDDILEDVSISDEKPELELSDADNDLPVLRCNRCNTPINPQNAVLTPTGYRCKNCIRGQQKVFDTSQPKDFLIAFLIAVVISFAGSWLVAPLGYIIVLVSFGLGLLIYRINRLILKGRRGKRIDLAVLLGALVGAAPLLIHNIILAVQPKMFIVVGRRIIWHIVYMALICASAYTQSKGARK